MSAHEPFVTPKSGVGDKTHSVASLGVTSVHGLGAQPLRLYAEP